MINMNDNKVYTAIGMMSGMSRDGIDVASIRTDGQSFNECCKSKTYPYTQEQRRIIADAVGYSELNDITRLAEKVITDTHIAAAKAFIEEFNVDPDLVSIHGQTIFHDPANGKTWQIGDFQKIANEINCDVVGDLRYADVAAGGEGAPLAPVFHQAYVQTDERPIVILNMGGISNITWLGPDKEKDMIAGDVGPANALIDDYMMHVKNEPYDKNGALASSGQVNEALLQKWLKNDYFSRDFPKSLDRDEFKVPEAYDLSEADGAATLSAFTVQGIATGIRMMPQPPKAVYVGGGGRHNDFMMCELATAIGCSVEPVEALGWNGDSLEADCWAYLGVRCLEGKPITFPNTTGVPEPMTGGVLYKPEVLSSNDALRPAMAK